MVVVSSDRRPHLCSNEPRRRSGVDGGPVGKVALTANHQRAAVVLDACFAVFEVDVHDRQHVPLDLVAAPSDEGGDLQMGVRVALLMCAFRKQV